MARNILTIELQPDALVFPTGKLSLAPAVNDQEVVDQTELDKLVASFLAEKGIKKQTAILALSPEVVYERSSIEDLQTVPFENLVTKTFEIATGQNILAVNGNLLEPVKLALEKYGVVVNTVMFGEQIFWQKNNSSPAPFKKNRNLIVLLPILLLALLVLGGAIWWNQSQINKVSSPTEIVLSPTPSVISVSEKGSIKISYSASAGTAALSLKNNLLADGWKNVDLVFTTDTASKSAVTFDTKTPVAWQEQIKNELSKLKITYVVASPNDQTTDASILLTNH